MAVGRDARRTAPSAPVERQPALRGSLPSGGFAMVFCHGDSMGLRDSGTIIRIHNQLGGVGIRMLGITNSHELGFSPYS